MVARALASTQTKIIISNEIIMKTNAIVSSIQASVRSDAAVPKDKVTSRTTQATAAATTTIITIAETIMRDVGQVASTATNSSATREATITTKTSSRISSIRTPKPSLEA